MKKFNWYLIGLSFVCIITLLWFSGLLPKQVAKIVADNYILNQENGHEYELESIEYSLTHDSYFVNFSLNGDKENGKTLNIPYKYFPFFVLSDSNELEYDNK